MNQTSLVPRKTLGPFTVYERVPKLRGLTKYVVGKGDELTDFGKFSTAVRWCKGQLPRPTPRIIVDAGTKKARANMPIDYTIIDGPYRYDSKATVDPSMTHEPAKVTTPDG